MTAEAKSCRKKWKIAVSILLAVLILLAGGFFWYVSDYYQAEDVALEVLASGDHLEVRDDLTILSLSYPTDTAIIRFCTGKARLTLVSAFSLTIETNTLSTTLYSACTSMLSMMGNAMLGSSLLMGCVPMIFSLLLPFFTILLSFLQYLTILTYNIIEENGEQCRNGSVPRCSMCAFCTNPGEIFHQYSVICP